MTKLTDEQLKLLAQHTLIVGVDSIATELLLLRAECRGARRYLDEIGPRDTISYRDNVVTPRLATDNAGFTP